MKQNKCIIASIIFLVLSILFTIAVKNYDVRELGEGGSSVGLAFLNAPFRSIFPGNELFGKISDFALGLALLTVPFFAFVGLSQLIKQKSLKKVDKSLFVLFGFYAAVALAYLAFEHFVINFRPIYIDGVLEPSYPSSHTLLSICLAFSAAKELSLLLNKKELNALFYLAAGIIVLITISCRIVSGVHWFSDILGGILIASTLVSAFFGVVSYLPAQKPVKSANSSSN